MAIFMYCIIFALELNIDDVDNNESFEYFYQKHQEQVMMIFTLNTYIGSISKFPTFVKR